MAPLSFRDLVENIMGQYLRFDFRNSGLRRKYDGLKYTLKNLENMLYELSLTHHSGGVKSRAKVSHQHSRMREIRREILRERERENVGGCWDQWALLACLTG